MSKLTSLQCFWSGLSQANIQAIVAKRSGGYSSYGASTTTGRVGSASPASPSPTPTCPMCNRLMVKRTARQGRNCGGQFLGMLELSTLHQHSTDLSPAPSVCGQRCDQWAMVRECKQWVGMFSRCFERPTHFPERDLLPVAVRFQARRN